jgi:hypothetical protein
MEPVRVKLYGLFTVTKRRYLWQLALTVLLLVVLLVMWWFLPNLQPVDGRGDPPHVAWAIWLLRYLPWVVAGLAVLVLLEAVVVFRRFARAEEERPASGT